jgi:hypothetical protein
MRPEDIREKLRKEPVRPLRVFLSDGACYDVRHPEVMIVSRTEISVGLGGGNGEIPDRLAHVDPIHVARIEPIDGRPGSTSP